MSATFTKEELEKVVETSRKRFANEKNWDKYYNYQKELSNRVSAAFMMHDVLTSIQWSNSKISRKEMLEKLIKIMEILGCEIEELNDYERVEV